MPTPGRPPVYPWSDWLGAVARGEVVTLRQGEHFVVSLATMRSQVYTACRRRGLAATVVQRERSLVLIAKGAQRSRYPWQDWLDGRRHTLLRGSDFHVRSDVMGAMVRTAAKKHGARVRVVVRGDYVDISPPALTRTGPPTLSPDPEQELMDAYCDSNALEP